MGQCAGQKTRYQSHPTRPCRGAIDKRERAVLEMIYQDLAARSPNNTISLPTFEAFFHINTVWSHSLYRKYALRDKNGLMWQEFYKLIQSAYVWQTEQDKSRFLFDLYDIDSRNGICYNGLIAILFTYPQKELMEIMKEQEFVDMLSSEKLHYFFAPEKKMEVTNIEDEDAKSYSFEDESTQFTTPALSRYVSLEEPQIMVQTMKLEAKKSDRKSSELTFSKKFYSTSIIKEYASFIFKRFGLEKNDGMIKFELFHKLVMSHPKIYGDFFYEGFHEYLWRIDKESNNFYFTKMEPTTQGYCQQISVGKSSKRLSSRYLLYVNSAIIIFDHKDLGTPIGINNLQDLFILPAKSDENLYGITLYHENQNYPQKSYYFQKRQEQLAWLKLTKQCERPDIYRKYRIQQVIGQGSFSKVHQCKEIETGDKFAVKIIDKKKLTEEDRKMLVSQWETLTLCEHPNILRGLKKYQTHAYLFLVTQLLNEGTLYEYVKSKSHVSEEEACRIVKQLLEAIKYIHSMGLIHRDLKLSNIMIKTKGDIVIPKIIDFGLAAYKINLKHFDSSQKYAGTPGFVAPELYKRQDYSESIDIFSLGVIMHFLLTGRLPFHSIDPYQVRQLTCACEISTQGKAWNDRSEACKDLLHKMLAMKQNRIDCETALKHEWITKNGQRSRS